MTLVYTNTILQSLNLVQHQIEVYLIDFSKFYYQTENLKTLLSASELSRVQRFKTWALQDDFIVQHGLTRQILGYHLNASPAEIEIDAPKFGKPQVNGLHFNISHADKYLAVAISEDIPVGIDIESMDRNIDLNHVAAIVLSDAERTALFSLPKDQQKITLLQTWVCKEAYWKFVGEGLNGMINQLEVSPTEKKNVYMMKGNSVSADDHQIYSIASPQHQLVGAVASQGTKAKVRIHFNELPTIT